jgi:hypothetical protein
LFFSIAMPAALLVLASATESELAAPVRNFYAAASTVRPLSQNGHEA